MLACFTSGSGSLASGMTWWSTIFCHVSQTDAWCFATIVSKRTSFGQGKCHRLLSSWIWLLSNTILKHICRLSLLEKAYAKLSWSYEGLDAGQTTDALIDMTGGIEETYDIKEIKDKNSFFDIIGAGLAHDGMQSLSLKKKDRKSD